MMIMVPIKRFEVDQLGENSCIADLVDFLCEHAVGFKYNNHSHCRIRLNTLEHSILRLYSYTYAMNFKPQASNPIDN